MDNIFTVELIKNKKMLEEFILFGYRVNHPYGTFRMTVMAAGILAIGMLGVREKPVGGIILIVIGVLFLLFALLKHKIALYQLKKADQTYCNQTKLTYQFANAGISLYQNDELEELLGGYSQITSFYEDERNYYMVRKKDELYLLPKRCFTKGEFKQFRSFVESRTHEQCVFVPTSIKNKWKVNRVKMKQMELE